MRPWHRCRLLTLATAFALLLLWIGMAEAHVEVEPLSAPPGEYSTLEFWVYHGCAAADTVRLDLKIPTGLVEVTPGFKPGWEVQLERAKLSVPTQVYGRTVTEAVTGVTWQGGRLPAQLMDSFPVTVFVTEAASTPLRFLVVQHCADSSKAQEFTPEVEIGQPKEEAPAGQNTRQQNLVSWLALGLSFVALVVALLSRPGQRTGAVKE